MKTKTFYDPGLLIAARKRKGLSRQQVAEELNRDYMAIYRSEVGRETSPQSLRSLCEFYEISLAEVLDSGLSRTA